MIRGMFVAVLALFLALIVGCGGGGGASSSTTAARATATRATNGPAAAIDPKSGPPGTEITITGSGWPADTVITLTAVSPDAKPYTTVLTDRSGSFRTRFFIEKKPDGSALETGRFDIIATAGSARVNVPFLVEVRRPVTGPGPGGG